MTDNIKDSKRMELICEFIKTGKQPEGYKITETKSGKYRLTKLKTTKETLEAKRSRLQKALEIRSESWGVSKMVEGCRGF